MEQATCKKCGGEMRLWLERSGFKSFACGSRGLGLARDRETISAYVTPRIMRVERVVGSFGRISAPTAERAVEQGRLAARGSGRARSGSSSRSPLDKGANA